jgi:c-di-GMP-binding flagellar brake protein YcgR
MAAATHSDRALRLPMAPGTALFLEYRIGGQSIKLKTTLVGFREEEYLIIQTPRKEGALFALPEAAEMIIRFLASGHVYGFPAHVLRVLGPPFYLTFLAFPQSIETVSLRDTPRLQVVLPITREGGDSLRECIVNVSRAGALLLLSRPPQVGDVLTISFHLPTGESVADLPCSVVRVHESPNGILSGVRFQGENEQVKPLARYVARSLEIQDWFPAEE